jgi:branched-chain amino acid transport system substrate-binding protein
VKKLVAIAVAISVVAALVFVGCVKPTAEAPAIPTEIRVGGADSHTGIYAFFSEGGRVGIEAAVDDINSSGGIYLKEYGKKLPVKYISTNNESDVTKAGVLAESMILQDKVDVMVQGLSICQLAAPVSTVCEKYQVPFVAASGPGEPWEAIRSTVQPPWDYTWCISFMIATPPPKGSVWDVPGITLADSVVAWLKTMLPPKTNAVAAMYAVDDPNGRGWYAIFPKLAEDAGYTVAGVDENLGLFPPGTKDFSSIINKWKSANVEVLLGNAPPDDTAPLLKQVWTMGFKPKAIMAGQAGISYEGVASFGGDIPNDIVADRWWYPTFDPAYSTGINGRTPQSLLDYWVQKTGRPAAEVNPAVGMGYMTAQVLFDAIERAGTLDGKTINEMFKTSHVNTIHYSPLVFDETHFGWYATCLGQWHKTNEASKWECDPIYAPAFHVPLTEFQFPIPYD